MKQCLFWFGKPTQVLRYQVIDLQVCGGGGLNDICCGMGERGLKRELSMFNVGYRHTQEL